MPLLNVNDGTGFQLNYEVHEGLVPEPILFVHGNLASNGWWYPAQEFWQAQARGQNFRSPLIYAEFRGCGGSSAPKDDSEVDMNRFADDFIGLVRSLNIGPVHLVGHSTGGLIVALMLAKSPELFKKAVLLDPVGATGVQFDQSMIGAFEQMKVSRDLVGTVMNATIYQNDPQSAFFRDVVVEDAFKAVKVVGHLVLKALDGFDARQDIAKITHPVLVLHGEHDKLLPMKDSEELASLIKTAQFVVIPDQGHCTNVECPEKFVALVRGFLF